MKAAWYQETGAARDVFQVGETDDPAAGSGEVVIRVQVHGVNPTDCKRRSGQRSPTAVGAAVARPCCTGCLVQME